MDPKTVSIALLAAAGAVAVITLLAALVLRNAGPERQAAVMPLALAAGFLLGYVEFFDLPRKWIPELWQTTVFVAILAGGLSSVALVIPRALIAGPLRIFVVLCCTLVSVVGKHAQIPWQFFGELIAIQVVTIYALRPLARSPAPVSGVPLAFGLACAAAAFVDGYVQDFNLARLFIVLGVMMAVSAGFGMLSLTAPFVRGAISFPTVLFAVMVAIAAFYLDTLPHYTFILLAGAPLAACLGYVPALQRRKWWCLGAVAALAVACLIPAVIVAVRHAPAFE